MKKLSLKTEKRSLFGRKVKTLRREGKLPGTIYGKNIKSASLTVLTSDFLKIYGQVGETGLVELSLAGEAQPVLIHNVQKDPVTDQPLHVEFFRVDLKEKVHANVPLAFIGESAAVANKIGVLLTLLDEVEVEALPTDLPEKITIDVSVLSEVGQELKVGYLKAPPGVTILTDAVLPVVKVGSLVSKEAEVEIAAEAAAAAAAEAAAPAEGEAAPAEAKPEEAVPASPTGARAGKQEKPKESKS